MILKRLSDFVNSSAYEFSEFERLFGDENKNSRRLVFYSEGSSYHKYFADYINYILQKSVIDICYLTSDISDPILKSEHTRIKAFYVKNLLSAVLSRLDAKALVLTTPDLNRCGIPRAPKTVEHIYTFHGVSSIHQSYKLGAFDYYDSILCINDIQMYELRKSEQIYGTKPKNLIKIGYPFIETLYRDHVKYLQSENKKEKLICLIAPSWSPSQRDSTIMDNGLIQLFDTFSSTNYDVWLRPHSEYVKRNPAQMQTIAQLLANRTNIYMQTALDSMEIIHKADFLITDHSSIAYDFALGTERPVLFIDTPIRVDNPERDKIGIVPFENIYRSEIGLSLPVSEIYKAENVLEDLYSSRQKYKERLIEIRKKLIANWQTATRYGGEYILSRC